MRLKKIILIYTIMALPFIVEATSFKSEYLDLESSYQKIDNTELETRLNELKPISHEEKAFVSYYKAKMIKDNENRELELLKVMESYPKTVYGQKACLDIGVMYFLLRDLGKSSVYLGKISSAILPIKDFWLSQIYLKQGENEKAIQSAQTFLIDSTDKDKIETAYYIIANAYINQRRYDSVQPLLDKLERMRDLPRHLVYYNYLRGYAYDMCNNYEMAIQYYKNIYKVDRYSQYAFVAENRLLAMKARRKNGLDISFIYPDSVYHPAPVMPDTSKTILVTLPIPGVDPPLDTVPDSTQMVRKTGHGIFLQLGRFSSETNAQNLMLKLKDDNFDAMYFPSKQDNKITYRVLMGPFKSESAAEKMRTKLNQKNYGSIIVKR